MNESVVKVVYADQWYGSSYSWFLGTSFVLGIFISLSNGLVIWLTFQSKNIRFRKTTWFVLALAAADFVFGLDKVIFLPVAFTFADQVPILCGLEACVHFTSGIVATSAPAMMAASRYYRITNGISCVTTNRFIHSIFFKKKSAIRLIAVCWLYFFFVTGVLLGFNQMGKSIHGFCGTKPFTSLSLYFFYLIAFMSFVFFSTIATIVYSVKLTRFMNEYTSNSTISIGIQEQETNETQALMKMIKVAAAQPFVFQFIPCLLLFLADFQLIPLPIAYGRILALIFALSALIDPWLSILFLRPYRDELVKIAEKFRQRGSRTSPIQHEIPSDVDVQRRIIHARRY